MLYRTCMRITAISLLLLFHADYSLAENSDNVVARGQIVKASGEVYVRDQKGAEHKVDTSKYVVHQADTVITKQDGKAVVKLNDGALTVLDENSQLLVKKPGWLSYLSGKIYFTFRKVFAGSRHIVTPFSTIGIRGTTFIVYSDKAGGGVALKEGRLELESPGKDYELHISRELKDFADFKKQQQEASQKMRNEFDDYKKQIKQEFVEYRKSFILQSNRVVRFNGNRVDETSMDSADNSEVSADFGNFEQEAGELLKQFRAQAKAHREQKPEQNTDQGSDDF